MRRIIETVGVAVLSIAALGAFGIALPESSRLSIPTIALAQSDQVASGEQVYRRACASCHGDAGEGIDDAPPLIGGGNALADYRTAARLYSFTSSEMPNDDPGSLTSQQYYDVVAYVIAQNGMNASGQAISSATAASINLTQ